LRSEGYAVDTYDDPVAAWPKLISARPSLLILNGYMPRMHGIEFFLRYRSVSSRPVLFMSASAEEIESTLAALGTPADAYLQKTFSLHHLRELVARLLAQ
jgi:DNA-binding response OmpR family regulator